jgi:Protein of unknown function (DUF732)
MLMQALVLAAVGATLAITGFRVGAPKQGKTQIDLRRLVSTASVATSRIVVTGALVLAVASPAIADSDHNEQSTEEDRVSGSSMPHRHGRPDGPPPGRGSLADAAVVANLREIPSLSAKPDDHLLRLGYRACAMRSHGYDGDDIVMGIAYTAAISEGDAVFLLKVVLPALCPSVIE